MDVNENIDYDSDFINDPRKRSVKKSDKLVYRQILQMKVDRCLSSIDTVHLSKHVTALKAGIYFDIPGLPFKSEIESKDKKLRAVLMSNVDNIFENKDISGHPLKAELFTIQPLYEYYYNLMEFLIELLAKHDALMAAVDHVESGDEG